MLALAFLLAAFRPPSLAVAFDEASAERFANLALACVAREYPNKVAHTLESDADAKPPRLLTPVFFGCYDWHSSVHGHRLLARLASRYPAARFVPAARAALRSSFTPEKVAGEIAYFEGNGRAARSFSAALLSESRRRISPKGDITCRYAAPAPSGKET